MGRRIVTAIDILRSQNADIKIERPRWWQLMGITQVQIVWPDNEMFIATCSRWQLNDVLKQALKFKENGE